MSKQDLRTISMYFTFRNTAPSSPLSLSALSYVYN